MFVYNAAGQEFNVSVMFHNFRRAEADIQICAQNTVTDNYIYVEWNLNLQYANLFNMSSVANASRDVHDNVMTHNHFQYDGSETFNFHIFHMDNTAGTLNMQNNYIHGNYIKTQNPYSNYYYGKGLVLPSGSRNNPAQNVVFNDNSSNYLTHNFIKLYDKSYSFFRCTSGLLR